nr:hypothetical protein CFP56_58357 [Quercus suber]
MGFLCLSLFANKYHYLGVWLRNKHYINVLAQLEAIMALVCKWWLLLLWYCTFFFLGRKCVIVLGLFFFSLF